MKYEICDDGSNNISGGSLHLEADRTITALNQLHSGQCQHHASISSPLRCLCFCHYPKTNLLILIQTSDVEEKPWKRKKYVTSKGSRQKLRKEDWMKKAAAKEDKVLR